jgi:hypothetical protein
MPSEVRGEKRKNPANDVSVDALKRAENRSTILSLRRQYVRKEMLASVR